MALSLVVPCSFSRLPTAFCRIIKIIAFICLASISLRLISLRIFSTWLTAHHGCLCLVWQLITAVLVARFRSRVPRLDFLWSTVVSLGIFIYFEQCLEMLVIFQFLHLILALSADVSYLPTAVIAHEFPISSMLPSGCSM